jgi:hypothetical protein
VQIGNVSSQCSGSRRDALRSSMAEGQQVHACGGRARFGVRQLGHMDHVVDALGVRR